MQLSAYLEKKSLTATEFAQSIGVHRSSIVRFCAGDRRPKLATIQRIHEATKGAVTAQDFFTDKPVRGAQ